MSSEVVDLHITFAYVFIPVTDCTCVCMGCSCTALACCWPSFLAVPAVLTWFHLFATVWLVTWPPLCSNWGHNFSTLFKSDVVDKDRHCCESWREPELGVSSVCAVGDTTDEDRWVDLLCCLPHCDTAESCLMNDTLTTFSSSSDCYDDWRRPSPTSSLFSRCHLLHSVPTCLLLIACC